MERALPAIDVAALLAHAYGVMDASDSAWLGLVDDLAARADGLAVPYSRAAEFLRVSVPTIATWVDRGVLDPVPDASVRSVSATSIARVESVLSNLDDRANRRVLNALVDALRDADLVRRAQQVLETSGPSDFVRIGG